MSPVLTALIVGFLVGLAFGISLVRGEPPARGGYQPRQNATPYRMPPRKP